MSSEEQRKKLVFDYLIAFGNISPSEAVLRLNRKYVKKFFSLATDRLAANEEIDEKTKATDDTFGHGKDDDETKSSATNSNSSPKTQSPRYSK